MSTPPTNVDAATPDSVAEAPSKPSEAEVKAALEANAAPFGPPFFIAHLGTLVAERGQAPEAALPRVVVHLVGGSLLDVHHVVRLTPKWIALEVYAEKERERTRTELVPYGIIMRVTIDSTRPDADGVIGFRQDKRPNMLDAPVRVSPEGEP